MTRIKICGIKTLRDALGAVEAGADAVGFVFAQSPRQVTPNQAKEIIQRIPPFVTTVGVFVGSGSEIGETADYCGLDALQIHSGYTAESIESVRNHRVILGVRIKDESSFKGIPGLQHACALLLDSYSAKALGGTGETFDWDLAGKARAVGKPIILSGGLNPDNVSEAVRIVRPYAVDVSSGVESAPGTKDLGKVRLFIERARAIDFS